MKFSITHKVSLLSILLVISTAGAVAFIFYQQSNVILVDWVLKDLSRNVANEGIKLTSQVDELRQDVRFLANLPPIQGIIRAQKNEGDDRLGKSTEDQWKRRLESIFSTLLHTHTDYLQARFIDAKGNELVRVEWDKGKVITVPSTRLQNKAGRPYVENTLKLLLHNEVYLSEITLNRERGHIVEPYVPLLRAATPIYDDSGRVFGLVVINVDIGKELARIEQRHTTQDQTIYITNDQGDFLIHPDVEKRFGFDLGNLHTFEDDFPQVGSFYERSSQETVYTLLPESDINPLAWVLVKIFFDSDEPKRFMVIGLTYPYEKIVSAQQSALTRVSWLSLILILIGTILALSFSKKLVNPLTQITQGLERFMLGNAKPALPIDRQDEIGILARAFDRLIRELGQFKTALDLTEDEVNAKERHLAMILDTSVEAIVSVDENQQICYFNRGAENIFGYVADEVIGQSLELLLPEFARQTHYALIQDFSISLKNTRAMDKRKEISGLRKDGTEFPAEASISMIESSEGTLFTAFLRDITERKLAQAALQQGHDKLEQRVQERTARLNEAKEEAEKANRAKTEFLSRMSHEFRTPMNAILGFGELLEADDEPLSETQMEYTKDILNAGYHLLDLINEVLDLSRIETGNIKIKFEAVDCYALMHECVALIKPLADKQGVNIDNQITHSKGVMLRGERIRLKEVVLNLLSNAVKYNREQGLITLVVEELSADRVRISVSDTGAGLSEEQQNRLFQPFERLGAENSKIEGTGIGLSISKRLMELMGGEIGIKSTPNHGSTFWIELDKAPNEKSVPEPEMPSSLERQANDHKKYKILYIEDNPSNMRLVEYALESRANIQLLSAMTPEQGLKVAVESQPDLILLDINLPEMDGYDVLNLLRAKKETHEIPVIAVSALATPKDIEKMKRAGFNDYLAKPFSLESFYKKIGQMLP